VTEVEYAEDICTLPLVRRMAALLDRDPDVLNNGDPLPRGWHVMLFNPPTRQSLLRHDGAAHLGFSMPDLGLPRLMMGGRNISFEADIPIGAAVRRESRLGPVSMKQGRSGTFALLEVEHRLSIAGDKTTAVTETTSYILRPGDNGLENKTQEKTQDREVVDLDYPPDAGVRTIIPDEPMLFRYSAITDNPHRIHYDKVYAKKIEGYPDLVVNGSLPQMVLLDLFRDHVGREPARYEGRNREPIFCGDELMLMVIKNEDHYALEVKTAAGRLAIEGKAW